MKIIVIDKCLQCPHLSKFRAKSKVECREKELFITDPYLIPKWCPLEDYDPTPQPK